MSAINANHFTGGQNLTEGTRRGNDSILKEILDDNQAKVASGGKTTSREENIAGLSSAVALANALKVTMDAHGADASEHTTAADETNFPIAAEVASNLVSLITLTTELLSAYVAHNADAVLASSWAFHAAQQAGNTVASAVAPTNLQECLARLNDIKAKYNTHEGSSTSHGSGSAHTEGQADVAYGAAIKVIVAGLLATDQIMWSILDNGTGSVTGVSAVAYMGYIIFTFSADPQNDAIISYIAMSAV